jgi:ArsR family transcriptional regulator
MEWHVPRQTTRNGKSCSPAPPRPKGEAVEVLAQLAWAIAHPARVQILKLLMARESCICGELVNELPLAQYTVSQHLKILKESGLVQGEIDGPKVCYCVNQEMLDRLKQLVADL